VDHGGVTGGEEVEMGSDMKRARKHGTRRAKQGDTTLGKRRAKQRRGPRRVMRLVTLALVAAAVVKEVRTPAGERSWHGVVAGFVPYDFRRPTAARFRERMWDPEGAHLISPRVFGVGWTVNAGRVVQLVKGKVAAAD
jgi:hypothetical protein